METPTYNYGEPGLDSVRCNNCMRLVGVVADSDVCPACGFDGGLMDAPWDSESEVNRSILETFDVRGIEVTIYFNDFDNTYGWSTLHDGKTGFPDLDYTRMDGSQAAGWEADQGFG